MQIFRDFAKVKVQLSWLNIVLCANIIASYIEENKLFSVIVCNYL